MRTQKLLSSVLEDEDTRTMIPCLTKYLPIMVLLPLIISLEEEKRHYAMWTLVSCLWGPVTAHGVGILTEMYVISKLPSGPISIPKTEFLGPMVLMLQMLTNEQTHS